MLLESVLQFFAHPLHVTTLIVSWALALISFLYWREHPQARYLYAHLFFLLVPLLDFAVAVPCNVPFIQGLLTFCSIVYTRLVFALIPFALVLAVVLGHYVSPAMYKKMYNAKPLKGARYQKLARDAGISGARFWVLDTGKPVAFSFGKDVLMSVGMFELLAKKEQDAVLFHELGHVKHQSSVSKFSLWLARLFSPLAHFASVGAHVCAEERAADNFAIHLQGTARHVNAAKKKVEAFMHL